MPQIAIFMVVIGCGILLYSLLPTKKILTLIPNHKEGWQLLYLLNVFFILGYLAYIYLLLNQPVGQLEFLGALVLFAGSFFVVVVTHLSLKSIKKINQIALLQEESSQRDNLTGLPNRQFLFNNIKRLIDRFSVNPESFSVSVFDLDNFKLINDGLGHSMGDLVLKEISKRLVRWLNEDEDILARLGGDEFVLVLSNLSLLEYETRIRRFSQAMEEPFVLEGEEYKINVSIGTSFFPEHGNNVESLLKKADSAMYHAKKYKLGSSIFKPSMDQTSITRLRMLGSLEHAVQQNGLDIHFQPIISSQGNIHAFEGLVRWKIDEHTFIPPTVFLPIAEQNGSMRQITDQVLRKSIEQLAIWNRYNKHIKVHINLSMTDIHDTSLPHTILRILGETGADPSKLVFEITESGMMTDVVIAHQVTEQLSRLGFELAIDDYGTGYSSLHYLRQLPISSLKIDKSFVKNLLINDHDANIVDSTIKLAHSLNCKVVAEGVEHQEQQNKLKELGCDYFQGFLIAKPAPGADFDTQQLLQGKCFFPPPADLAPKHQARSSDYY